MMRNWLSRPLWSILLLLPTALPAAEPLCRPMDMPQTPETPVVTGPDRMLRLWSDMAELEEKTRDGMFLGNVLVRRQDQVLRAEKVTYRHAEDAILATGEATLWDPRFTAKAQEVTLIGETRGEAVAAEYWLPTRRGHGEAEKVIRQGEHKIHLDEGYYTTCDPEKEFWRLQAQNIDLDLAEDIGVARDVTVRLGGTPVLYAPYVSFPLSDQRKSGLLPPKMGQSDTRGLEFELPYYWNIAPNYDATFTPRLMTKRGLGLNSEFRYLSARSQGTAEWEFLPNDREFDEDRSFFRLNHQTRFNQSLLGTVLYQEASDNHYFEDMGTGLEMSNTTYLERRGDLWINGGWFAALARVHDYQTLDPNPAMRPYRRLPQIRMLTGWPGGNRALNVRLQGDLTWFDRDLETAKTPTGLRNDWQAKISYPFRQAGWFVDPAVTFHYTRYALEDQPTGYDGQLDRFVPKFTLDTGLIFERALPFRQREWLQTLEPRLFYRHAPHRDQDEIPVFDTAATGFTLAQMFRSEFYAGPDRVGDEQRLTAAVFSRILDPNNGEERLRLGLGQMVYFNDPEVALPGQTATNQDQSDLIGEISVKPTPAWMFTHMTHWGEEQNTARQHLFRARYHPEPWKALNFAYRMRDESLGEAMEQTDISWQWPLSRHWRSLGRWNYSLEHQESLEALLGLEYESCCWAIRTVFRRYLRNTSGEFSNGVYVQFELKGLGRLGKKTSTLLTEQIPGFSPLIGE